jgi:acetate kinase
MRIAVVNAGSATVKAALAEVDDDGARVLERARCTLSAEQKLSGAFEVALAETGALAGAVDGIAHRVVHGGREFTEPVRIDSRVEHAIEKLGALAPLHNPPALEGIRIARQLLPGKPMVAVFDTAFHAGRAPESMRYALPWELADSLDLLRYGFHGIAHASLVESLAEAQDCSAEAVAAVTLQLGAGCSACAVANGRSVETTMGFSPLEGLVMATRAGDVDATVVLELQRHGRDLEEVRDLLTRRSGLLGLAGAQDLRHVLAAEAEGDERARVAVDLFVRRIVASVGAYWTLLGGEGALVFGGGIGTHSAEIRRRVAQKLGAWNVRLDPDRNAGSPIGRISADASRPVFVFETDEERLLARSAYAVLTG